MDHIKTVIDNLLSHLNWETNQKNIPEGLLLLRILSLRGYVYEIGIYDRDEYIFRDRDKDFLCLLEDVDGFLSVKDVIFQIEQKKIEFAIDK